MPNLPHSSSRNLAALAAVMLLFLTGMILLGQQATRPNKASSVHAFSVQILNDRQDTYIWVDNRVHASVWKPGSDAGDDAVASTVGRLELPHNRFGSGFNVPENKFASGLISLPKDFDLRRYISSGYELRLSVYVVPRGYHSSEFPFNPGADIELGNAFAQIGLNSHFPPKVMYLTYRP